MVLEVKGPVENFWFLYKNAKIWQKLLIQISKVLGRCIVHTQCTSLIFSKLAEKYATALEWCINPASSFDKVGVSFQYESSLYNVPLSPGVPVERVRDTAPWCDGGECHSQHLSMDNRWVTHGSHGNQGDTGQAVIPPAEPPESTVHTPALRYPTPIHVTLWRAARGGGARPTTLVLVLGAL